MKKKYSYKNMSVEERCYSRYIRALKSVGRIFDKATYSKKLTKVYFNRAFKVVKLAQSIAVEKRMSIEEFIPKPLDKNNNNI